MIVETQVHEECTCHFDDSAYTSATQEDVDRILNRFSAFIQECFRRKRETA